MCDLDREHSYQESVSYRPEIEFGLLLAIIVTSVCVGGETVSSQELGKPH